jgi:hypothetical protein
MTKTNLYLTTPMEIVIPPETLPMETDPVSTINTQLQHREISNKYTRDLHFSKSYMRKKRQQNREMAIGSLKISRYFKPLTASVTAAPAAVNHEVVGTEQSAEVEKK